MRCGQAGQQSEHPHSGFAKHAQARADYFSSTCLAGQDIAAGVALAGGRAIDADQAMLLGAASRVRAQTRLCGLRALSDS